MKGACGVIVADMVMLSACLGKDSPVGEAIIRDVCEMQEREVCIVK